MVNQDSTARKRVQKLKVDCVYTFCKKDHQQQIRFNADVDEHIQNSHE